MNAQTLIDSIFHLKRPEIGDLVVAMPDGDTIKVDRDGTAWHHGQNGWKKAEAPLRGFNKDSSGTPLVVDITPAAAYQDPQSIIGYRLNWLGLGFSRKGVQSATLLVKDPR